MKKEREYDSRESRKAFTAVDLRKAFLDGRNYERAFEGKKFTKKGIMLAGRSLLENWPAYRKPDDGNGDEFNAGYNEALDKVASIILDNFGKI